MSEDIWEPDKLAEEAVPEEMEGKIVYAVFPCDCEVCIKGDRRLEEMGSERRSVSRLHITAEDVHGERGDLHEWYTPSKTVKSKWGALMKRLKDLGVDPTKDVKETIDDENHIRGLEDATFVWESEPVEVGIGGRKVDTWLPKEVVELPKRGSAEELEV